MKKMSSPKIFNIYFLLICIILISKINTDSSSTQNSLSNNKTNSSSLSSSQKQEASPVKSSANQSPSINLPIHSSAKNNLNLTNSSDASNSKLNITNNATHTNITQESSFNSSLLDMKKNHTNDYEDDEIRRKKRKKRWYDEWDEIWKEIWDEEWDDILDEIWDEEWEEEWKTIWEIILGEEKAHKSEKKIAHGYEDDEEVQFEKEEDEVYASKNKRKNKIDNDDEEVEFDSIIKENPTKEVDEEVDYEDEYKNYTEKEENNEDKKDNTTYQKNSNLTEEKNKNITLDKNITLEKNISKESINQTNETTPQKENEEDIHKNKTNKLSSSSVILYGFERYNYDEAKNIISFYAIFVPVYKKILAQKIKLSLKIKYGQSLRLIQDSNKEIECTKKGMRNRQISYYCEFTPDKKNIESIEVDEDIEFIDQHVNIKACTPMAIKELKNLKLSEGQEKFKNYLYILESSEKYLSKKQFNIIGKINDKKFDHDEMVLTIISQEKQDELNIKCSIEKDRGKYQISCKPKDNINGDLDGAIGKLDNEILLINFKKGKDSSINFKIKKPDEKKQVTNPPKETEKKTPETKNDNDDLENEEIGFFSTQNVIYIIITFIIILILTIIFLFVCKFRKSERPFSRRQVDDLSSTEAIINNQ